MKVKLKLTIQQEQLIGIQNYKTRISTSTIFIQYLRWTIDKELEEKRIGIIIG